MTEQDLFLLLALQKVELVGDVVAKKLLNQFENPAEIFKAKANDLTSIEGVGAILVRNLKDKSVFTKAESELKFIQDNEINVHFYKENSYSSVNCSFQLSILTQPRGRSCDRAKRKRRAIRSWEHTAIL